MITNKLLADKIEVVPAAHANEAEVPSDLEANVEFDNFTHVEIALRDREAGRLATEHLQWRMLPLRKMHMIVRSPTHLNALFRRITGRDLEKSHVFKRSLTCLLKRWSTQDSSADEGAPTPRDPGRDEGVAALNHQPVTVDTWKMNQESG